MELAKDKFINSYKCLSAISTQVLSSNSKNDPQGKKNLIIKTMRVSVTEQTISSSSQISCLIPCKIGKTFFMLDYKYLLSVSGSEQ